MIGSADCDMPIVATCPRFCSGTTELRSGWCRRARYWDCSTTAAYRPYTTFVPLSRNPPSGKAPDLGSGNPVFDSPHPDHLFFDNLIAFAMSGIGRSLQALVFQTSQPGWTPGFRSISVPC